jgi:mono/diheme cytochrome c family protein
METGEKTEVSETAAGRAYSTLPAGDTERGREVFANQCSACHYHDRTDSKLGPGLEGLLTRDALPSSGRPATLENVLSQLRSPIGTMPSFKSLGDRPAADLLAYLETL